MNAAFSGSGPAGRIAALALGLVVVVTLLVLLPSAAHAATFTVNKIGDGKDRKLSDNVCDSARKRGKQCTLRAAIQETNDTTGPDTINFNIRSRGSVKTISPASDLPEITEAVTINGYSQPGTLRAGVSLLHPDAILLIQLNGTNAGTGANGLAIRAAGSKIEGLVINRFEENGIEMQGSGATNNVVEGNYIGTNAAGTADLGNGENGVRSSADDNTVGGTSSGARNIISGNGDDGVDLGGAIRNEVLGNFIGTNAAGTSDLGNSRTGVAIFSTSDNTIGGTAAGERNVISGNESDGVEISGSTATGNEVLGNFIGTGRDGTTALGNTGDGVVINSANNTTIGGNASGAGNRIAHNDGDGVLVVGGGAVGNRVLSNSIFSNGGLGIDLGTEGVTANDTDDPDTGPNNLQNFPVLASATRSNANGLTTISGALNSNPNADFLVQCFVTETPPDPSGHGEGQLPAGQDTTVSTHSGGDASFSCASPIPQAGQSVTTTATNTATGDTSEFSLNQTAVAGP